MLIISGVFEIRADKREDAFAVIRTMVAATEQEPGCITYRFYEDISQANRVLVYEEWESAENLAAHFETPHMAVFRAAIPDILVGSPKIMRHDVAESQEM